MGIKKSNDIVDPDFTDDLLDNSQSQGDKRPRHHIRLAPQRHRSRGLKSKPIVPSLITAENLVSHTKRFHTMHFSPQGSRTPLTATIIKNQNKIVNAK